MAVALVVRRQGTSPNAPLAEIGKATVAADGTFMVQARLAGCDPNTAEGTQYVISAVEDITSNSPRPALASVTFTVSSTVLPGLPNTGGGGARTQASLGGPLAVGAFFVAVAGIALEYGGLRRRHGRRPTAGASKEP